MHLAAEMGWTRTIISLFRSRNSNLDVLNSNRDSPLHFAARNGSSRSIILLIRLGTQSIDIENSQEYTPIMLAHKYKHRKCI